MATTLITKQAVATTSAVSLYSPAANTKTEIQQFTICNTTAGAVTISIFKDNDGTTYDATTALKFEQSIAAKATETWDNQRCNMTNTSGNFAIQASANNSITVTIDGIEFT